LATKAAILGVGLALAASPAAIAANSASLDAFWAGNGENRLPGENPWGDGPTLSPTPGNAPGELAHTDVPDLPPTATTGSLTGGDDPADGGFGAGGGFDDLAIDALPEAPTLDPTTVGTDATLIEFDSSIGIDLGSPAPPSGSTGAIGVPAPGAGSAMLLVGAASLRRSRRR
jgi:hypothetical protein